MATASKTDEPGTDVSKAIEGDVLPFGAAPLTVPSEFGVAQRVADLIPTPAKWAEYDQIDIDELVGEDFKLVDAMFFDSTMEGAGDEWCIMLGATRDGQVFTTMTGGSIVVRKLHKLMQFPIGGNEYRNVLPVVARITKTDSQTRGHSAYYDLI